jgi:RNA polymerase sigma factor (sigma-70 family)
MKRITSSGIDALKRSEERLRGAPLLGLGGDVAAYRNFLQLLGTHLRAYFRRRLFNWPDDVEDLVQETLMAVHTRRETYQPDQPLTAWVHAIARYKLIDLLRSRSVREALHDPIDDEFELFASSDQEAGDARRDLGTLLASLPERQRVPIDMVKIQGRSVAETAASTGMSESAVKVGIHRGLRALATRHAQRGEA